MYRNLVDANVVNLTPLNTCSSIVFCTAILGQKQSPIGHLVNFILILHIKDHTISNHYYILYSIMYQHVLYFYSLVLYFRVNSRENRAAKIISIIRIIEENMKNREN